LACNVYSDDCFIAQVAEVSVGRTTGDIRVHRIVCAIDCGRVINPLGLDGQAESGITWGLTATLHGRIDFKNGTAVQENYVDYEVIRMNEAPVIETHFVPSDLPPEASERRLYLQSHRQWRTQSSPQRESGSEDYRSLREN
jgi:CO/xanthine dehydrogenase Mo-binding subunit